MTSKQTELLMSPCCMVSTESDILTRFVAVFKIGNGE